MLDAFEKAARANGPRDRRFRIEHAQHVRAEDVARYKDLGVIASIQPSHCIDDMRFAAARIGPARCPDAYRFRSFAAAGVPLAFGTDWFVEPLDPRLGLYAAVTRERPEGGPARRLWPRREDQSRGGARFLHARLRLRGVRGDGQGDLEPGKLADLVVFAQDLFRVQAREILATPVDLTVVGGRVVFERKP